MNAYKLFNSLCTPAQLYLGLSIIAVLSSCIQNIGNPNSFACGLMKAPSPINNAVYIVFEVVYVLVRTYLLNLLCKKGYSKISFITIYCYVCFNWTFNSFFKPYVNIYIN